MDIFKVFRVDAAHRLPNVPAGHKCAQMHGHSFRIEIQIRGPVDSVRGWVMDFAEVGQAFQSLYEQLDHSCLNEIEGLENPTSENIARWIWKRLHPALPMLRKIIVQESPECGVIYRGEDSSS